MKKVLASLFTILLLWEGASAQTPLRPTELGVSFFLNDYATARLIRTTSLSYVKGNHKWTSLGQQSPGLAVHYFKGLQSHLDLAATLAASYVTYTVNGQSNSSDGLLLEGDVSGNFRLFAEDYVATPYVIAGAGISKYRAYWGAFVPLGLGVKANLFGEADVFITFQYRVPVTKETTDYHFFTSIGIAGLLGKSKE